jgi:hypothetical protein
MRSFVEVCTGLLVESFEPFAYNKFQSGLELVGGEGGALL